MTFAKNLLEKALQFIQILNVDNKINFLNNYLSVHVRRSDFVRRNEVVSLKKICKQIIMTLKKLNLFKVFLATDGTELGN